MEENDGGERESDGSKEGAMVEMQKGGERKKGYDERRKMEWWEIGVR